MSDLDFFLTASLFSVLGYVLCYLTLSSKEKYKSKDSDTKRIYSTKASLITSDEEIL